MTLVNHSLGAVTVQQVDGQKQGGRHELEGSVGLDEEVQEVWAHEPLNLGLDINRLDVRYGLFLNPVRYKTRQDGGFVGGTYVHMQHVAQDIVPELITGKAGQLVRDGVLTLTSYQLVLLFLGLTFSTKAEIVFDEERVTGLEAGPRAEIIHDDDRQRERWILINFAEYREGIWKEGGALGRHDERREWQSSGLDEGANE